MGEAALKLLTDDEREAVMAALLKCVADESMSRVQRRGAWKQYCALHAARSVEFVTAMERGQGLA